MAWNHTVGASLVESKRAPVVTEVRRRQLDPLDGPARTTLARQRIESAIREQHRIGTRTGVRTRAPTRRPNGARTPPPATSLAPDSRPRPDPESLQRRQQLLVGQRASNTRSKRRSSGRCSTSDQEKVPCPPSPSFASRPGAGAVRDGPGRRQGQRFRGNNLHEFK